MSTKKTVRVPKSAGPEITITRAGESRTYKVSDDGSVSVDEADLSVFLAVVDGSTEAKPATTKEK